MSLNKIIFELCYLYDIRQTGENSLHNMRIFIPEEAHYVADNLLALVRVTAHEVVDCDHCSTSDVGLEEFFI
jgi:hypothetical protein